MGEGKEVITRSDSQVEIQVLSVLSLKRCTGFSDRLLLHVKSSIFFVARWSVNYMTWQECDIFLLLCWFCILILRKGERYSSSTGQKLGKKNRTGQRTSRDYVVLRPESGERPVEEKQDPALSGTESESKGKNNVGGAMSSSERDKSTNLGGSDGDHEGGRGTQVRLLTWNGLKILGIGRWCDYVSVFIFLCITIYHTWVVSWSWTFLPCNMDSEEGSVTCVLLLQFFSSWFFEFHVFQFERR